MTLSETSEPGLGPRGSIRDDVRGLSLAIARYQWTVVFLYVHEILAALV